MRVDSEMIGILLSGSMHYTIVVSLEMSDELKKYRNPQKCKYCLLKHQLYDACTKRDAGATAMVSHNIMNAERLHKAACWRYSLVDDKAT